MSQLCIVCHANKATWILLDWFGCCSCKCDSIFEKKKEKKKKWESTNGRCELYLCCLIQQSDSFMGYKSLSACSTEGDLMEATQQCVADCYSNMLSILAVPVLVKPQEARDVTLRYHRANVSLCKWQTDTGEGGDHISNYTLWSFFCPCLIQ